MVEKPKPTTPRRQLSESKLSAMQVESDVNINWMSDWKRWGLSYVLIIVALRIFVMNFTVISTDMQWTLVFILHGMVSSNFCLFYYIYAII